MAISSSKNMDLALVANLYNVDAKRHGGRCEAVYNSKLPSDCETGTCVLDWERGVAGGIPENPWQTDTCIGDWHYNREAKYKSPKYVIDHARRHRQPEWKPAAEFPPTKQR